MGEKRASLPLPPSPSPPSYPSPTGWGGTQYLSLFPVAVSVSVRRTFTWESQCEHFQTELQSQASDRRKQNACVSAVAIRSWDTSCVSGVEQEGETTFATVTTSLTCLLLTLQVVMCVSGHNKVYDFSVSIEGGRCHMACVARFTMYHSSGDFAALYSHTTG